MSEIVDSGMKFADVSPDEAVSTCTEVLELPNYVDDEYVLKDDNCVKIDGQTISQSGGNVVKRIIRPGVGDYPLPHSYVTVHFTGKITADGRVFDSSVGKDPFVFQMGENDVVRAWEIGIPTMKVGELAVFECSADFCYGHIGNPDADIEEGTALTFEVELMSFEAGRKKVREGLGKQCLKKGWGMTAPEHGSVCTIYIQGRAEAATGDVVFLDIQQDPVLVRIDDCYLPKGIEYALCNMKKGEMSLFEVCPDFVGNGFEPMRHTAPFPKDKNLYYTIELVDVERLPETWNMKPTDKVDEARRLKNCGNEFFKTSQFDRAYTRYKHSLEYFEFDDVKTMIENEQELVNSIRVVCLNNMQVVAMKDTNYKLVIEHATASLEIDPNHIRSLYRRAQAYIHTHDRELARQDITRSLEQIEAGQVPYTEALKKDFTNLLAFIEKKLQDEARRGQKIWSKAFQNVYNSDDQQ